MSAPDVWCGNCGAHFTRCTCGVSAREVFTEPPTFEQFDAICRRRFPSSLAMLSDKEWVRYVEAYARDIAQDCVTKGESLAVGREIVSAHIPGISNEAAMQVAAHYLDARMREHWQRTPFGIIQTVEGEPICVFIADAGIELVTATGKTATLERKQAQRLAKTLLEASTFRKASEI